MSKPKLNETPDDAISKHQESLTSDDQLHLIALLNEYKTKLVETANKIEDLKSGLYYKNSVFFSLGLIFIVVAAIFLIFNQRNLLKNTSFMIVFCLSSHVITLFVKQKKEAQLVKRLDYEAQAIALNLEQIINFTESLQIQSPHQSIVQLKLNLHLSSAKSVLDYYYSTSKKV